eukprot:TRINITY_DN4757_c0_g1_i4.p1 TRINITY_DN4757_c0_g1~~TRINITY_DN4757_c0_g1_i4.p1  ORF type:complete len:1102 (-),score=297.41 TRINITY_DN4757_c0_g1_i4:36-3005(-)
MTQCGELRAKLSARRSGVRSSRIGRLSISNPDCAALLLRTQLRPPFDACQFQYDKEYRGSEAGHINWEATSCRWSTLLDEKNYAVLLPPQQESNFCINYDHHTISWSAPEPDGAVLACKIHAKYISCSQASYWLEGRALMCIALPCFRMPMATREKPDSGKMRVPPADFGLLQHLDLLVFTFECPDRFPGILQCLGKLGLVSQELALFDSTVCFAPDRDYVYDRINKMPYRVRWKVRELISHSAVPVAGAEAVAFVNFVVDEALADYGDREPRVLLALMRLSERYLNSDRNKPRRSRAAAASAPVATGHKALHPLAELRTILAVGEDSHYVGTQKPLLLPYADAAAAAATDDLAAAASIGAGIVVGGGGGDADGIVDRGKNNWVLTPTLLVTPSKVFCCGPYAQQSNRMLRTFAEHLRQFVRVHFVDEPMSPVWDSAGGSAARLYDQIHWLLGPQGMNLFGKRYNFVMYSQSQLREHSCWMLEYLPGDNLHPADLQTWMSGPHQEAQRIRNVPKFAARLGLTLTTTTATGETPSTRRRPDIIRNDKCFTDGCGLISPTLMRRLFSKTQWPTPPSALQIRFRGCKGMLVTSAAPLDSVDVELTDSMVKYEGSKSPLEICKVSQHLTCYLNRQIVLLLGAMGVPPAFFERLQQRFLDLITAARTSQQEAHRFLVQHGASAFSGWWAAVIRLALPGLFCGTSAEAPADLLGSFMADSLVVALNLQVIYLRKKTRLPLENACKVFGVADFSGTLKPDEVFLQLSCVDGVTPVVGDVLVYRDPSLHCGDIRRLHAVAPSSVPTLAHLFDVVVFPTTGERPQQDMMSGGDLDGDEYSVIWDPDLLQLTEGRMVAPLVYDPLLAVPMPEGVAITSRDLVANFISNMRNTKLGVVCNMHLATADREGPKHPNCVELAKLASHAVDFPKSGVPIEIPQCLQPSEYPHWMEKRDKSEYRSISAVAKLYNSLVKSLGFHGGDCDKEALSRSWSKLRDHHL